MVHQGSSRRIFKKSSAPSRRQAARIGGGASTLSAATSYYLPEGRYYEAPLIVRKTPSSSRKLLLSTVVGAGVALASVSSLQQPHMGSFIAANTTVAVRDSKKDGRQKMPLHQRRAALMVASHERQRLSLATLTMQLDTKPQHVAQLIRPDGDLAPAFDETRWMVALAPIVQQWTGKLTSHLEQFTHFMTAATPAPQPDLQPVLVAQADIVPEVQTQADMVPEVQTQATATPIETASSTQIVAMLDRKEVPAPSVPQPHFASNEPIVSSFPVFWKAVKPDVVEQVPVEVAKITPVPVSNVPIPKQKELPTLPVPHMLASLVTNDKPDILALGYAPTMQGRGETPFDSILTGADKNQGRFIPPIGVKDHAWAANPLPPVAFTRKEQKCLAEAIYFESRGEKLKGQAAVAQVVLNRVRNPAYPTTICGVVYQNSSWRNRCQFSFACDGRRRKVTDMKHWQIAQDIAKAVTAGQIWLPEVGSSTHYHAVYVRPKWARSMYKLEKIGLHVFYRTKGGGWS